MTIELIQIYNSLDEDTKEMIDGYIRYLALRNDTEKQTSKAVIEPIKACR